jgi:predicted transglutaminase-like cysteine proteinase
MKKQMLLFFSLFGICEATQNIEHVDKVNRYFNTFQYVSDMELHKIKDKWMSPQEFKDLKSGDCEDFAIAKFFELLKSGIPENQLLLVYSFYKNEAHMVLVYYDQNNQPYILDNITDELLKPEDTPLLRSVYGFNTHSMYILPNFYAKDSAIERKNTIKYFHRIVEDELSI